MRKDLIYKNTEDFSEYMTRAAEGLRSIRDGKVTSWGLNLKEELSKEEQDEFREYVIKLAVDEMERTTGKHCIKKHRFDMDKDDFLSNFKIVILKYIENYNDSEHLTEGGKRYQFSTFLKHLSTEAVCMTYADIHGVSKNVEKKFAVILAAMRTLAAKKQISTEDVTPEMIHEEKPSITIQDIKAVIDFTKGKVSLDGMLMEDGLEGKIFKGQEDVETNKLDVLDVKVEKLLDAFIGGLRDVEKFFALVEIGCSERHYAMTAPQLSCDELLVKIVAVDPKFKKNIEQGDLIIRRPNRSTAKDVEEVKLYDVLYVNDSLIRYQRSQAKKQWKKLAEVISMDDICGNCGVEYFRVQWQSLCEKYDEKSNYVFKEVSSPS